MLYKFKIFEPFSREIKHGISMREGGVSEGAFESLNLGLKLGDSDENLQKNYKKFCDEVGIDIERLCLGYQEHTDNILCVKSLDDRTFGLENPFNDIDGFITNMSGIALMVRFADCQGVMMLDPVKRVVAAVHSGWRGNVMNIIGKCVGMMVRDFGCDAGDILVGISPSLGPCCAEFNSPFEELPEFIHKYVKDRHVDFWQCSLDQLVEAGVSAENIEIARRCTVCENDKFFSYRGGKRKTGHMGGVISLI
jgi:hypothetical protein